MGNARARLASGGITLDTLGAYAVARLPAASILLRRADPRRDRFAPLGGNPESMPLSSNVVVYAIGDEILCWSFNCRDSHRYALTPDTEDAVFIGEAVVPEQWGELHDALAELAGTLTDAGAASGPMSMTTAERPRVDV